jgi:hypothetical protein
MITIDSKVFLPLDDISKCWKLRHGPSHIPLIGVILSFGLRDNV